MPFLLFSPSLSPFKSTKELRTVAQVIDSIKQELKHFEQEFDSDTANKAFIPYQCLRTTYNHCQAHIMDFDREQKQNFPHSLLEKYAACEDLVKALRKELVRANEKITSLEYADTRLMPDKYADIRNIGFITGGSAFLGCITQNFPLACLVCACLTCCRASIEENIKENRTTLGKFLQDRIDLLDEATRGLTFARDELLENDAQKMKMA